jgi:hypothetical protein
MDGLLWQRCLVVVVVVVVGVCWTPLLLCCLRIAVMVGCC